MARHMTRAFLFFEKDGKEIHQKVTSIQYRELVRTNPPFEHRLQCPDAHCQGAVHAHTEAKNQRVDANHRYTAEGFSHNKGEAKPGCTYSHKSDPSFGDIPKNGHIKETKEKVRASFADYRLGILGDLQTLFGPKEDVEAQFKKMQTTLCDHEFYAKRPRVAPFAYAARRGPFEMTFKNGNVAEVAYKLDGETTKEFNSLRGHKRKERLPAVIQLVYLPSEVPVPTYRFQIAFPQGGSTEITRDLTLSKYGPRSVLPENRRLKVMSPRAYLNSDLKLGS